MYKTIALIPARQGSKGVLNKNIREICKQPLISYSILDALRTPFIEEVYVSTDSKHIANISLQYGAEVPFLRPKELAQDDSLLIDVVQHFLQEFYNINQYYPELIALLVPTTPIRNINIINEAILKIQKNPEATGLRSVHEFIESPYKWFTIKEEVLEPLFSQDISNLDKPRQCMPKVYVPNGYIDIIKPQIVLKTNKVYGERILSYLTSYTIEIDNEEQLALAEIMMKKIELP